MRRGDVVLVAVPGDYGKPRPAVVIQSDQLTGTDSILVCLITSELQPSLVFRLSVDPAAENGLKKRSQVMVDKIFAVRRDKCKGPVGRLDNPLVARLDEHLPLVIGLADRQA